MWWTCYKCKVKKHKCFFTRDRTRKRGYSYDCSKCRNKRYKVGRKESKQFDLDLLFELFILRGWPQHKIGKRLGCSQSYVGRLLKQHNMMQPRLLRKRDEYNRKKMDNGYMLTYCPDHPRAERKGKRKGFVREHILVVEGAIDRPVQPYECVPHINGDKLDNRIENLFLCDNRKHQALHAQLERVSMQLVRDNIIMFKGGRYVTA